MGKRTDRGRLTATEVKAFLGGASVDGAARAPPAHLAFGCCALTFLPCTDAAPVTTPDGTLLDAGAAIPFVRAHGVHPVTGEALSVAELTPLRFHHGADGALACPALGKPLTDATHVVAIRTTGNVYCRDAVDELCVKAGQLIDLVDGETPFTKADIITLQDPSTPRLSNATAFAHVTRGLAVPGREEEGGGAGRVDHSRVGPDARRALAALDAAATAAATPTIADDPRLRAPKRAAVATPAFRPGATTWATDEKAGDVTAAVSADIAAAIAASTAPHAARRAPQPYADDPTRIRVDPLRTTGAQSRGFTSTVGGASTTTTNERASSRIYINPTAKGYARLHTSKGDINLELHCDVAPRACENFLTLARSGYFNGVGFHRLIRHFMIQGGDPTETGLGGESIYGGTFDNECDPRLSHDARGVVAMANAGPGTNGSQFYITLKSCRHLDGKHTVFARVVGGAETLAAIERVPTRDDDTPTERIEITNVTVFVDPFEDERKRRADAEAATAKPRQAGKGAFFVAPKEGGGGGGGVGRYLPTAAHASSGGGGGSGGRDVQTGDAEAAAALPPAKKKKRPAINFDAW